MMWNRTSLFAMMIIAALLLTATSAWGQCFFTLTVSGTVVDSLTDQPVAGVSISMEGYWHQTNCEIWPWICPCSTATDVRGGFLMSCDLLIPCDWPEGGLTCLKFKLSGYDSTKQCRFFPYPVGGGTDTWTLGIVYVHQVGVFVCGDCDGSETVALPDVFFLCSYIFGGGPAPQPLAAGDVNCDGRINLSDAVYLVNHIFSGGPPPCEGCK